MNDVLLNDRRYFQNVMRAIGRTMLLFLLLIHIFGAGIGALALVLSFLPITPVSYNVIFNLVYAAGYMLSFMLPAWFLRRFLRSQGCAVQSMALSPRISPMIVPIIFAGVTVCFAMTEINAAILDLFGYFDFGSDLIEPVTTAMAPYEIVLNFIVVSIVPAFGEEFLFRGAILSNCRPFGRTNAILISAVLFALMHQNAEQLLYTFVAGIVLGLVYEYTGSIWNCTVLHLFNNLISVVQTTVLSKYGESEYAAVVLTAIEVVIYLAGAISIGFLICKYFSQRPSIEDGVFEKTLPASDSYAAHPIRGREAARQFFCPSMIVFFVLVGVEMVSLIVFSLII